MLFGILVLPNCAKYKPTTIAHPEGETQENGNVKMVARKLSRSECATCFDSPSVSKKYVAIQLYVKNKTDKSIVLSANRLNMPVASSKKVSKIVYRNTAARVGGYLGGALLVWPLVIPAAVDGVKSSKANSYVDRDISEKVLGQNEKVIIKPHNSVNKIIFVTPQDLKDELVVTLTRKNLSNPLDFNFIL